jgi:predicted dehydrogenase
MGRMGLTHLAILNGHPEVQFSAVCEESKLVAHVVGKQLGFRVYGDYRRMLEKEELDCLLVATPSGAHAALAAEAIRHNLHVFVEKPFCLDCEAGRRVLDGLKGKRLVNQVGYVNRFNEMFVLVKQLLDDGLIGEVLHCRSEMYGSTVLRDAKETWRTTKAQGGGCLREFASHAIDLMNYFVGMPDTVSGSVLQSVCSSEVEDAVYSTFHYRSGAVGTLAVNWSDESCRKPVNRVEFFGTKGKILADKHCCKVFLREVSAGSGFSRGWNVRYITDVAKPVRFYLRGNEFTRQLDYFIESMRIQRQDNVCSFERAWQTDLLIERIINDSQGNRVEGQHG